MELDTLDDFNFDIRENSTNDINELEKQLKETINQDEMRKNSNGGGFMNMMSNILGGGINNEDNDNVKKVKFSQDNESSNLGNIAKNSYLNNEFDGNKYNTNWNNSNSGFKTANELPNIFANEFSNTNNMNSGFNSSNENNSQNVRKENISKKNMLLKLQKWKKKYENDGFKTETDENSSYADVCDEYNYYNDLIKKNRGIKLYKEYLTCFAHTIETTNAYVDPFGLNLDGLGEYFSDNSDEYEDIFEELYEKYKMDKMPPELSLMFKIAMSIATVNFFNKQIVNTSNNNNNIGMNDIGMDKNGSNANLMHTLFNMMQQTPGGMANNKGTNEYLSNMTRQPPIDTRYGPPPAPIETKKTPTQSQKINMDLLNQEKNEQLNKINDNNRPDIQSARGIIFNQGGVDLQNNYQSINKQQIQIPTNIQNLESNGKPQQKITRKEMNSPTKTFEDFNTLSINDDLDLDNLSNISANSITNIQGKIPRKNNKGKNGKKKLTELVMSDL